LALEPSDAQAALEELAEALKDEAGIDIPVHWLQQRLVLVEGPGS
jgi:hypothetical protein